MDLQKLSNQAEDAQGDHFAGSMVPTPKRRWLTRVALPLAIVLATLALILYAARDVISPATEVSTTRAVALTLSGTEQTDQPAAPGTPTVVAQAPGWVEPDPYPVYAGGLANGIVESVHVLEGQPVKADQLLVELIDEDAKLALAQAKAALAKSEAAYAAAKTELAEPIALQRAEAVSRAQVASKQAALSRLDAEIAQEQARLDELTAAYDRLSKLGKESVSELKVEEAKYRAKSQRAAVEATRQRHPELEADLETAKAEHAAAKRDLELKTQLTRVRDEALAERDAALTSLAQAELRLERMTIHSPIEGVVMKRLVGPGSKLMLEMDNPHSAHAIHLYDPEQLQVRVDVPLADAAKVGLGQRAEVIVDVLPDVVFTGRVTRLVNKADIAKNTVQFKVSIADPSPLLKPDMLARVKFYGGSGAAAVSHAATTSPAGSPVAILQSAVVQQDAGPYVWWVSPTNQRLEQRTITTGESRSDGTVVVTSGLNPGDVVVNHPDTDLQENQRVHSREH